jgi:hypothetical protein
VGTYQRRVDLNKRIALSAAALASLIVGLGLWAQGPDAAPLSPPARYLKAAPKHPRGRVAPPPAVQAERLLAHPPRDFPNVTLKAYDSRAEGKLAPPFRDQGQCGSCWDFSGIRTIAYARMKSGLTPFQFSEQYILDCVPSGGCNGDDNTTVLKAAKQKGLPADADYDHYHASSGRCHYDGKLVTIDDWVFVDGDAGYDRVGNTQKIKNAIYATGAVGCAVAANSSWDGYSGGVHRGHSRQIDHDVVLTGWQDDPSIPEGGWWWMDNSWGASWGEGGRMKIAYGADSIGTEPVAVVLPQPVPPPPGPDDGTPVPLWKVLVAVGLAVAMALALVAVYLSNRKKATPAK